jgi:MscS family membrane protein
MRKLNESRTWWRRFFRTAAVAMVLVAGPLALRPQFAAALKKDPEPPVKTEAEVEKDPLGRTTPKGTVLGFLEASHDQNFELATEYLDPRSRRKGSNPKELAEKFAVVLDRRLPAKLKRLSDRPEGASDDPLNPNRDLVGTIETSNGPLEILVERVDDPKQGKIWLFSDETLKAIPDVFDEINESGISSRMPEILVVNRIAGIPISEWLAVFLGIPFLYVLASLLNRALSAIAGLVKRRGAPRQGAANPVVLSPPIRLLLVALAMIALRSELGISLLARQFWANTAGVLVLLAVPWLLIRLSGRAENFFDKRLRKRRLEGTASVLRLVRRLVDVLIIFAGVIAILFVFGINPGPALAGLGVGGIAVALAAQKTLENVIGGASIILDQAVRVGDVLKFGSVQGTVEQVGLRSTVVRTPERTLVSVPNGQLANANIERVSARDKFWFHPTISLEYGTSASQVEMILKNIQGFLGSQPSVERETDRITLTGLGTYSLNLEVSAYVFAPTWELFLVIQEALLLGLMQIVENAGSRIALPSHVVISGREPIMSGNATLGPAAQVQRVSEVGEVR